MKKHTDSVTPTESNVVAWRWRLRGRITGEWTDWRNCTKSEYESFNDKSRDWGDNVFETQELVPLPKETP